MFAQSESPVHDAGLGGVVPVDAGGSVDAGGGAGSVGDVLSSGTSALFAQAAAATAKTTAPRVTANADFEMLDFTAGTLREDFRK